MEKCKIQENECVYLNYLIGAAQRDINGTVSMVSKVEKSQFTKSRDAFIEELNQQIDNDKKSLSDAIEVLYNCGCKDVGLAVLFE